MELSNLKIKLYLLAILICQIVSAQNKGIILDIDTNKPISYVNIYTTHNNVFFGTTSNASGEFNVNFVFKKLTFSHINYEKSRILCNNLKDTIFLVPKTNFIDEVVISNKQPEWIYGILEQFRVQRKKRYRKSEKIFSYQYETTTLNDSSGYAFKSNGGLIVPKLKAKPFRIAPKENVINYKDNSAGVDFSNMQRILYNDFIVDFNKRFIRKHEFKQNYAYKGENKNAVQLIFNSKKHDLDKGSIVIDTATCIILEVERSTGTDYNVKKRTSAALRTIASKTKGFKYEEWNVYNYTRYQSFNGSYYPIDCKYKFYMKSSTKKKKKNNLYFISIESKLSLMEGNSTSRNDYIDIQRPYYMLLIKSKKRRLNEERLRNVPVRFETF